MELMCRLIQAFYDQLWLLQYAVLRFLSHNPIMIQDKFFPTYLHDSRIFLYGHVYDSSPSLECTKYYQQIPY